MRQRQIQIQRSDLDDHLSPGDLVNRLTQKITSQMPRPVQSKIEKNVADQFQTNTCSICFQLMLPPQHSPMLLFPCGHTFCKVCLQTNQKKTGKKKCPWCRSRIQSQAVNHSLQNLIVAYASQKHKEVIQQKAPQDQSIQRYLQELQNFNLRCKLLQQEREQTDQQLQVVKMSLQRHEQQVATLKREENQALQRLRAAEDEVELVREYLRKAENQGDKVKQKIRELENTQVLIEDTIKPLLREKEKVVAIIDIKNKRY